MDLNLVQEKVNDLNAAITLSLPPNINSEHRAACFLGALLTHIAQNRPKAPLDICANLQLLTEPLHLVSKGLLRLKGDEILKLIYLPKVKEPYFEQSAFHAIDCFHILFTCADESTLLKPSFKHAMEILVGLSMGTFPKVQRRARKTLHRLLQHSPTHPHLNTIAQCISNVFQHYSKKENALTLLDSLFKYFTSIQVEAFIDQIYPLSLHPKYQASILRLFSTALRQHASTWTSDRTLVLFNAFLGLKPKLSDVELSSLWVQEFGKCFVLLCDIESFDLRSNCYTYLMDHVFPFYESKHPRVLEATSYTLSNMITTCITPCVVETAKKEDTSNLIKDDSNIFSSSLFLRPLASFFEHYFQISFLHAWGHLLCNLALVFQKLGKLSAIYMKDLLLLIEKIGNQPGFPYPGEFELFLQAAVRYMGPESVLNLLPLNLEYSDNPNIRVRTYLINIMETSVQNTELSFFINYFLPLAETLLTKSKFVPSSSKEAKDMETLYTQIWSLLPRFCIFPTDFKETYSFLIPKLTTVFNEQPNLRSILSRSFCNLIEKLQEFLQIFKESNVPTYDESLISPISPTLAKEYLDILTTAAKEWLPLCFNVFRDTPPVSRSPIIAAIRSLVSIAPLDIIGLLYDQVLQLMQVQQPLEIQQTLLELAILLVPRLPNAMAVEPFVSIALQALPHKPFQKKAYKLLSNMLEFPLCREYFNSNLHLLETDSILPPSIEKTHVNARRNQFLFLHQVIQHLNCLDCIPKLLPILVLGLKDENTKCRVAASSLLNQCILKYGEQQGMAPISTLMTDLLQALNSKNPLIVSAIFLAIGRLCYSFASSFSSNFLDTLLTKLPTFVGYKKKAISKSILSLFRVFCVAIPLDQFQRSLPSMVQTLSLMAQKMPPGFAPPLRRVFQLFINRVGYDPVYALTPEPQQKFLKNILKRMRRSQRKPSSESATNPSSSASLTHSDSSSKEKSNFNKLLSSTALQSFEEILYGGMESDSDSELEGEEDDENERGIEPFNSVSKGLLKAEKKNPIDLLDSNLVSTILGSTTGYTKKSYEKARQKLASSFAMSEDGKIIIDSDEDLTNSTDSEDEPVNDSLLPVNVKDQENMYLESIQNPDAIQKSGRKFGFNTSASSLMDRPSSSFSTSFSSFSSSIPSKSSLETGEKYQSKKGLGDVKRAGLPDPFAYIPLGAKLTGSTRQKNSRSNSTNSHLHRVIHRKIKKHKK